MAHWGTLTKGKKKIVSQLSVQKVLPSVSLIRGSTLRFVVSAGACGVQVEEMNCAIRRV